jgi:hypothetical protein
MDDLNELKNYIKNKYNIDIYINKSRKTKRMKYIEKIEHVYQILLVYFILFIIILFIIYYIYKKYKLFNNIIFNILILTIIIVIIYVLQKYLFMIYLYNKYHNKNVSYENNSLNFDDIEFETGDILQETTNWNYKYGILLYLFPLDFLHNIFIIKFKNKIYGFHLVNKNFGYPNNVITFNTKHLEIFLLNDYIKSNYNKIKYYRILKINSKIDNNNVFNFLKSLNMNNLKYSFLPFKDYNENKYNCSNFILTLLNYLNIVPKYNFCNFTSDNFIYLPILSNNIYNEPFIIKTM